MDTTELLVGQRIADRYEVVRQLGEGAMSTIYLVKHVNMGRLFAMKVIRRDVTDPLKTKQFIARFEREAQLMSKIDHPNCVSIVDFGRDASGELYLVMEYIEGRWLLDQLGKPMPLPRVVNIIEQVLFAVEHAHRAGVAHRDIKPENIMLAAAPSGGDLVKVLDFGLAKMIEPDEGIDPITKHRVVCGTPSYMAPEQARGEEADERSDLYAVGVILFYLLTGRPPFSAPNQIALLEIKNKQDAPSLDEVCPGKYGIALQDVVSKALKREPEARFQHASEFREALGNALVVDSFYSSPAAPEISDVTMSMVAPRRSLYWLGGGVLLGVFVLVGSVAAFVLSGSESAPLTERARDALVIDTLMRRDASSVDVERISVKDSREPVPQGHSSDDKIKKTEPSVEVESSLRLARTQLKQGKCHEAIASMRAHHLQRSGDARVLIVLGSALMCVGEAQEGIATFRRALEIDPTLKNDRRFLDELGAALSVVPVRDEVLTLLTDQVGKPALTTLLGATTFQDYTFRHKAISAVTKLDGNAFIDWVTVHHLDLEQLKPCEQRAQIVEALGKLKDARAIGVLRSARAQKKHACVHRQIDKVLKGKTVRKK